MGINGTPKEHKGIKCKLVFKIKQNVDATVAKYKAWLVALGFTQNQGVDFNEAFTSC